MIMSGEARRCYHGVPKILRAGPDSRNWVDDLSETDGKRDDTNESEFVLRYLDQHRINVNIRQVH
jgi:hypothetical protein